MKQKLLLFTLLLLVGTMVVNAQAYLNPLQGSTHTYTATVTDGGSPNPVRWYVATNAAGTSKAVHGSDFTFNTAGYVAGTQQLEGNAVYEVEIEWGTALAGAANFYVFIEVDDDQTLCTNTMGLHVQIASDFNAVAYNVTGAALPGTANPASPTTDIITDDCPSVIDPIYNLVTGGHTNIGNYEVVYRVNREFSLLAWQFEYQLSEQAAQAFAVESIRMVNESGSTIYNGTNLTGIIPVANDQDYVLVYVTITNQQGATLDMDFNLLTAGGNTKDASNNVDGNTADNLASFKIKAMPAITGFGGM
ncbi:MAG TPA: hypothetical protein VJY41_06765 [Prolixibacteraceae bacterium]|nr:hypothetical protein [Prolixibacteraceae bacterium]